MPIPDKECPCWECVWTRALLKLDLDLTSHEGPNDPHDWRETPDPVVLDVTDPWVVQE
jgi:hypothetical protein